MATHVAVVLRPRAKNVAARFESRPSFPWSFLSSGRADGRSWSKQRQRYQRQVLVRSRCSTVGILSGVGSTAATRFMGARSGQGYYVLPSMTGCCATTGTTCCCSRGGLPLTDLAEAYAVDLIHLNQVAEICCCRASFFQAAVGKGALPVGKTGRAPRLVPAEVALWQQREWTTRQPRVNKQPRKKSALQAR